MSDKEPEDGDDDVSPFDILDDGEEFDNIQPEADPSSVINPFAKGFWDSTNQGKKANAFIKRHRLDRGNANVKLAVRALFRAKEELLLNNGSMNDGRSEADLMEDFNVLMQNVDSFKIDPNSPLQPLRDLIRKQLQLPDASDIPAPVNYHTDLELHEWIIKYCGGLFTRKVFLTPSECLKLTKEEISNLPDARYRQFNRTQLADLAYGNAVKTPDGKRMVGRPFVMKRGLYKSQIAILKHFKDHPWAAIEIFRSAGKTYIVLAILAYMILENPRKCYAYICEEQGKAEARLKTIRNILTSKEVVTDYGYRINAGAMRGRTGSKGKDAGDEFYCFRGSYIDGNEFHSIAPTLMAMSWTDKKAQGFHYNGVVFDDIWSIKFQTTDGSREKFMAWWGEFEGCLDFCEFFFILRTKKGINDLYSDLDKMGLWVKLNIPLVKKFPPPNSYEYVFDEKTEVWSIKITDPALFAEGELFDDCFGKYWFISDASHPDIPPPRQLLLWKKRDPMGFEREIQNNPYLPTGKLFKWSNAHFFPGKTDNMDSLDPFVRGFYNEYLVCPRIAIMDNSWGISETADYNVLITMSKYRGRYMTEAMEVGRWGTSSDRVAKVAEVMKRHPGIEVWVEADRQSHIIRDLIAGLKECGFKKPLIKEFISKGKGMEKKDIYRNMYIKSTTKSDPKAAKKGKIHSALEAPFNNGLMWFNSDIKWLESPDGLKDQILQFPDCIKFDILDTEAMGIMVLRDKTRSVVGGSASNVKAVPIAVSGGSMRMTERDPWG